MTQKGSLVAPDRLRFDYSHNKPLSAEEILIIEREVNDQIRLNTPTNVRIMRPDEASKEGALALFGEKYGEEVRVVSMGHDTGEPFSVELCGGTHVAQTGDIGYFKIISESGIAAGIRRIEALTGSQAEDFANEQLKIVLSLADKIKISPSSLTEKITQLIEERKSLEKEVGTLRQKLATSDRPNSEAGSC